MAVRFTEQDLAIFEIPDFAGRMPEIRNQIRPKLEALGPQSRGYKAYVYFCIGKGGAQARVTRKDESALRAALDENLLRKGVKIR